MSYVVESGASRSRRARRRRTLITLGIVALMLFFAFWYAYSYYQDSDKAGATPAPTCTPTATSTASRVPSQVTVNVYNATDRTGLAAKTASDVRKRGFKVSAVSNDPLQRQVAIAAEVRYGTTGSRLGQARARPGQGVQGGQGQPHRCLGRPRAGRQVHRPDAGPQGHRRRGHCSGLLSRIP